MASQTEVVLSTTTDSQSVAEAAAADNEEGARVPVEESSLSEFKQSADGRVLSYESPQSERKTLLERLEQHADDLQQFTVEPELEAEAEGEPEREAGDVDMEAVRKAATEHAIRDGEAWVAQQHAQQFTGVDEYNQALQEAKAGFDARIEELKGAHPEDFTKVLQQTQKADVQFRQPLAEALIALPGGADLVFYLAQNPREARQLVALPDHVAVAKIGQLAARLTTPKVPVSRAPRPITPVSGASTKSTVPMDEMPYQDFARAREREIKGRYRR